MNHNVVAAKDQDRMYYNIHKLPAAVIPVVDTKTVDVV